MDDATQKLVDGWEQAVSAESLRGQDALIRVVGAGGRLRDALEAAQRPPANPVVEAIDAARDSIARGELASVVIDTDDYPQRPPVSPEVRDALIETVAQALRPRDFEDEHAEYPMQSREEWEVGQAVARAEAAPVVRALLARFSFPSQPVYDEEAVAGFVRDLAEHGIRFDLNPTVDASRSAYAYVEYIGRIDRSIRERAVAALRGGELTREETNE